MHLAAISVGNEQSVLKTEINSLLSKGYILYKIDMTIYHFNAVEMSNIWLVH